MTKEQMIKKWLSPSTCKEQSILRALKRTQKGVIEQLYYNSCLSNNERRMLFYRALNDPLCKVGQRKYYFWR